MESFKGDPVTVAAVLESLAEGVLVWTPSGRISGCNPAAERILARPRSELLAKRRRTLSSTWLMPSELPSSLDLVP